MRLSGRIRTRLPAAIGMRDHGIVPINWTTIAAELQRNWTLPTGQEMVKLFHEHYLPYGLLVDSFEAATAIRKAS
jgi:hypothetical protein